MNILKSFSNLQVVCKKSYEDSNLSLSHYFCAFENDGRSCNEHVCPLLDHKCKHCDPDKIRSKAMKEYWKKRKEAEKTIRAPVLGAKGRNITSKCS
jgi:hypothetical protein